MPTLKLVFVRRLTPYSLSIRLVDGFLSGRISMAAWSHVAVVMADDESVVEAPFVCGGVTTLRPLGAFLAAYPAHRVIEVACDAQRLAIALGWLLAQVGAGYDWRALSGLLADRDLHAGRRWYCFELAGEVLRRLGVRVTDGRVRCDALLEACDAWPVITPPA